MRIFLLVAVLSSLFLSMAAADASPSNVSPLNVSPTDNIQRVKIKTSAICDMCKVSIERALLKLQGVQTAELDLVTKKVNIRYDADQLSVATLRQAIAAVGYDADEVTARPKAYDSLAACCKKGSSCDMPSEGQ